MLRGTKILNVETNQIVERIFPLEQYWTTNEFAPIRPNSGPFNLSKLVEYTLYVGNLGTNSAQLQILASLDNDNFDIILDNEIELRQKEYLIITYSSPYKKLQILAKSKVPNQSTILISKGYGFGGDE